MDLQHPGHPVYPFSGEFCETVTDVQVKGIGPDLQFTRTYLWCSADGNGFGKGQLLQNHPRPSAAS